MKLNPLPLALLAGVGALFGAPYLLTAQREHLEPRDLGAAIGGRYLRAGGYEICYTDEGPPDRMPIVLLHGFASWSFSWRNQRTALLQAGYRVITLDLLGSGASERALGPVYSTASHANCVLALLDGLHVLQAIIIGHSFGARVGMQIAINSPARVAALIAIAPEAYATERPSVARTMTIPVVGYALTSYATAPALVRTGLKLAVKHDQCLTDTLIAGYARPLFVRGSVLSQIWQAKSPKDGARPVPQHHADIGCPTLLIWGADDPIFPAEHGRQLVRAIPDATLTIIDNVGHIPHEEDEPPTMAAILGFLAERGV
jgi:pimeloyl-ACP methyl ester carboxylesterase